MIVPDADAEGGANFDTEQWRSHFRALTCQVWNSEDIRHSRREERKVIAGPSQPSCRYRRKAAGWCRNRRPTGYRHRRRQDRKSAGASGRRARDRPAAPVPKRAGDEEGRHQAEQDTRREIARRGWRNRSAQHLSRESMSAAFTFLPALAAIDDHDDEQHHRHLDQHADDGGQRRARFEAEQADPRRPPPARRSCWRRSAPEGRTPVVTSPSGRFRGQ